MLSIKRKQVPHNAQPVGESTTRRTANATSCPPCTAGMLHDVAPRKLLTNSAGHTPTTATRSYPAPEHADDDFGEAACAPSQSRFHPRTPHTDKCQRSSPRSPADASCHTPSCRPFGGTARICTAPAVQRRPWVETYWDTSDPALVDGPGAESFAAFIQRVRATLSRLARLFCSSDITVAMFGHGQFFQAMRWLIETDTAIIDADAMGAFRLPVERCRSRVMKKSG